MSDYTGKVAVVTGGPEQGAPAIRARAEGVVAGRNAGDDSVDPDVRRSTGRDPS